MKFSRISVYTNPTSIKKKCSAAEDKSVTVTGTNSVHWITSSLAQRSGLKLYKSLLIKTNKLMIFVPDCVMRLPVPN